MFRLLNYERPNGSVPYLEWVERLDRQARSKVLMAVARLEDGNTSNLKRVGEIFELRIYWGPGYRIYLSLEGERVVILFGGGIKQRQQADITRASEFYSEYKKRKTKGPGK